MIKFQWISFSACFPAVLIAPGSLDANLFNSRPLTPTTQIRIALQIARGLKNWAEHEYGDFGLEVKGVLWSSDVEHYLLARSVSSTPDTNAFAELLFFIIVGRKHACELSEGNLTQEMKEAGCCSEIISIARKCFQCKNKLQVLSTVVFDLNSLLSETDRKQVRACDHINNYCHETFLAYEKIWEQLKLQCTALIELACKLKKEPELMQPMNDPLDLQELNELATNRDQTLEHELIKMAKALGGVHHEGPIKTDARVKEKAAKDYDNKVARVLDVIRHTFVFTPQQMCEFLEKIQDCKCLLRLKDRLSVSHVTGHRDVQLNFCCGLVGETSESGRPKTFVFEILLMLPEFWNMKDRGHCALEGRRALQN